MRVPLQIGRKTDRSASTAVSIERLINAYLESAPTGKEQAPVFGTPGLVTHATCGDGPIREAIERNDKVYAVSGGGLYEVDSAGTASLLGTGIPDGPTSMAANLSDIVIEAGGQIWAWDGSTLTRNTDPDALPAQGVASTDAFWVFFERDGEQVFSSEINDPLAYDALDFAAADWKPDQGVAPIEQAGTLYLFGKRSLQAFYYDAGAGFPFSPYKDVKIDVGLAGKNAVAATNETLFWLGHDGSIRRLDGGTATPIQTPAIHRIIMGDPANGLPGWANLDRTFASAHVWQGHLFIVFSNPDGCVVYDQTTQLWHERKSYGMKGWRVGAHVDAFGHVLFGDRFNGNLYRLASDAYDEAGSILPFEMVTPYAWANGRRGFVNEVEVIPEPGMCAIGLNPKIMLERTLDGKVWSDPIERSLGEQGAYRQRVKFGRQGQGRAMAFRLRITDACKRAILGIYADVEIEP